MTMTCGKFMRRCSPFCLAAVVIISGCEGYPTSDGQAAHKKPHKATVAQVKPASRRTIEAATLPANLQTAPQARDVVADSAPYVGLAEAQLMARLGQPSVEREDQPPGKTWRYQNKNCTVDFMLYPDVETRIYRALAYEVINDDKSAAGKRLCLAELEARAHGQ
jgi:hypothetical protein